MVAATLGGEQESSKSEDGQDVATKAGLDRNSGQGTRKSNSDGNNKAVVVGEPSDATDAEACVQESTEEGVVGMRNSRSGTQGGQKRENTPGPGLLQGGGPKLLVYGGRSRDGIADWNSLYSFDLSKDRRE